MTVRIAENEASFPFEVGKAFVRYDSPITIPRVCYSFFERHVGVCDVTIVTPDGGHHRGHVLHGGSSRSPYFRITSSTGDPSAGLGGFSVGDRVRVTVVVGSAEVTIRLEPLA